MQINDNIKEILNSLIFQIDIRKHHCEKTFHKSFDGKFLLAKETGFKFIYISV